MLDRSARWKVYLDMDQEASCILEMIFCRGEEDEWNGLEN